MESITVKELNRLISRVNLIDIRDNYKYNLGSVPTAVNIPASFLLMNPDNYINKEDTFYIFCQMGSTSNRVCMKLSREGYRVVDVMGGYDEYKRLKDSNVI